jgi:uncharacterized protein YcnI
MIRQRCIRFAPAVLAVLAVLAGTGPTPDLWAHAVVYPEVAAPGAYQKYVLRVPNERGVPTVRIEVTFQPDVRVISFADVAGWDLEIARDEAGRITGASWTGELPVGRFIEFPFVGVNPSESVELVWPVVQTYADGERVEWSGPAGSATPASRTQVRPKGEPGRGLPLALSAAAIVASLLALGVALRPRAGPS